VPSERRWPVCRSAERSAAGESASALAVGWGVVELVVVVERPTRRPARAPRRAGRCSARLDLLLGRRYLQVIGTYRDPAERHKGQVAADEALLDGGELRLVVLDVDLGRAGVSGRPVAGSAAPCPWGKSARARRPVPLSWSGRLPASRPSSWQCCFLCEVVIWTAVELDAGEDWRRLRE
jgi:hypothetical protein